MTKSELMAAAAPATNMTDFLTALALPLSPAARAAMWARLGQHGIDTSHWSRSPRGGKKYNDEDLQRAVADSTSVAQVLRRLNIKPAGGSHFYISKRIRAAGLETSHFLGRASARGRHQPRKSADEILVVLAPGSLRQSATSSCEP